MSVRVEGMALTTGVDLKAVAKALEGYTVVRGNPLIVSLGKDSYVIVAAFGAVVFWNYAPVGEDPPVLRRILDAGVWETDDRARDSLTVQPAAGADEITFNEVRLADAGIDRVYLVAQAFAQSLSLERVELDVERILAGLVPLLADLREDGIISMGSRKLLQKVGFSMAVQAEVLSGLAILDRPAETWDNEQAAKLFDRLTDHFDIPQRRAALETKVEFIKSSLSVIMDVVNNSKSHRLEIIIIALIAWEVILPLLQHLGLWFRPVA